MKKTFFKICLAVAVLCLIAACHNPDGNNKENKSESKKKEETIKKQEKVDVSLPLEQLPQPYDGTEDCEYLKAVQNVAKTMVKNDFTYDLSGIRTSLDKAVEKNHHGDCAHLLVWALQDINVLDKNQTFYAKKKGILSCKKDGKTYKRLTEAADIIEIDGIPFSKQEDLKKVLKTGDICCYNKHMNVVAGLDEKGNILYYDAGLTPVEGHRAGGKFTEALTKPYPRPKSRNKLYTIIRLK